MPDRITDPPPADVANQLAVLSTALDQVIPPKQPGQNLLIGTWNVRAFDRLTPKWRQGLGIVRACLVGDARVGGPG